MHLWFRPFCVFEKLVAVFHEKETCGNALALAVLLILALVKLLDYNHEDQEVAKC